MNDDELIAEFMGISIANSMGLLWIVQNDYDMPDYRNGQTYSPSNNWNQLMPVVQRIYKLYDDFNFTSVAQENMFLHVLENPIKYTIQVIYKDIVEFIKWYNSQKS